MIVRCTGCKSAYTVSDEKINNKKFAFTCPKCSTENIIDNRGKNASEEKKEKQPAFQTAGIAAGAAAAGAAASAAISDDFDFSDTPLTSKKTSVPDSGYADFSDLDLEIDTPETVSQPSSSVTDSDSPEKSSLPDDFDLDLDIDSIKASGEHDHGEFVSFDNTESHDFLEKPLIAEDISATAKNRSDEYEFAALEETLIESEDIPLSLPDIEKIKNDKKSQPSDLDEDLELDDIKVYDHSSTLDDLDTVQNTSLEEINLDPESPLINNSLDIEDDYIMTGIDDKSAPAVKSEELYSINSSKLDDDDNTTIDLDSLDIEVAEADEILQGEKPDELDIDIDSITEKKKEPHQMKRSDEDDITIDLDSLDIPLEESTELKEGEILDEDERLTLEDAGLTMDELEEATSTASSALDDMDDDEDIKLSLDEIDPTLDLNTINETLQDDDNILPAGSYVTSERPLAERINDLPEIDILDDVIEHDLPSHDDFSSSGTENQDFDFDFDIPKTGLAAAGLAAGATGIASAAMSSKSSADSMLELEEDKIISIDDDIGPEESDETFYKKIPDTVPKGSLSLSIDYSLKNSRLGMLLRLTGLYTIAMLPQFIVILLYSILSGILNLLNSIVVLTTGNSVEDFNEIQENTLRSYFSATSACCGLVEDYPIFAGRDHIDYPLQLKITYPLKSSKFLAFLRLTVAGIIIASLPHLVLSILLAVAMPVIFAVGMIIVLITGRWPHRLFDFITVYFRYLAKVYAFCTGLIDEYPSFRFD